MNSKLLKALPVIAIALMAAAPLSHATKYSPAQFNAELKKKVGTKTGTAAVNAAGNFYKKALTDKANKKLAATYANFVVKALKYPKVVPTALAGKSVSTLIKLLQQGYFAGGTKFSLTDSVYNKALDVFMKSLPSTAKASSIVSESIYLVIKSFITGKGTSQFDAYTFYNNLAKKNKVVDAPTS
jgi:hypothetical protein